jgi:menaquinone-dependent protoporphyrinogen IX oxidase
MERKQITCPETGSLAEVELESTPLGLVVTGCSRFQRDKGLVCTRECARRLDRRDHRMVDDHERVLMIFGGHSHQIVRIAEALTEDLTRDGFIVERALLELGPPPPLEDYDVVLIGAHVLLGRHSKLVADYIRAHESALAAMPTFLFAVGGPGLPSSAGYVERMTRRTGWHPTASATFDTSGPIRDQIFDLARRVADEIPPPVLQMSLQ